MSRTASNAPRLLTRVHESRAALFDGRRPLIDQLEDSRTVALLQYDPKITEADLDALEECLVAFIGRRRRHLRKMMEGKSVADPPIDRAGACA